MINKFLSSSLIYAGSSFMFSVGRQVVFFPSLQKLSPELFMKISFLVVLIDFLIYTMGASLADYYARNVTKNNKSYQLFKFLFYFSYTSLVSVLVFLYYDLNLSISLILSIYILFYTLNTLQMKLFFNNLNFSINYLYISMRLVPYFTLIVYQYYFSINSLQIFVTMLLLFEMLAYFTFKIQLKELYNQLSMVSGIYDNKIFMFIIIYALSALVLRFDMFLIEYKFPESFSMYYQMISVYMIFVNPVILLTSASLLSILTHVDMKSFIENKYKILIMILSISFMSGLLFQFFGEYAINFLYPNNTLMSMYTYLSFFIIFTTLCFQIIKTFIIKYSTLKKMFLLNFVSLSFPLFFIDEMLNFIIVFFITRASIYCIEFILLKEFK